MPRLLRLSLAVALAVSSTACIPDVGTGRERTGFISAVTYDAGGGNTSMRLTGAFYRYDGLQTGLQEPETCVGLPFSLVPPSVANLPSLDAGNFLFTDIGGRRDTLFRSSGLGITTYQLVSVVGIPFTGGDTLRLEIPGNVDGFPAGVMQVRTAEPFTFDPIGEPAEQQPLPITWTAAPQPGSLMTFSLRFSDGTGDQPNVQIYCTFTDDGAGQVPADLAAIWASSAPVTRRVLATRIRVNELEFDRRTRAFLLSYFDQPLSPLPGS